MSFGKTWPPELLTPVPGPRSRELADRLAKVESRNVTCLAPTAPIFWERASGANVWDVDGNRFIDLGGGLGVANVGHGHPRVVEAVASQMGRLLHAMGDVHPPDVKVALLEVLVAHFPGGEPARAVLGCSGTDAVETALKTAMISIGRSGVVEGMVSFSWRLSSRVRYSVRSMINRANDRWASWFSGSLSSSPVDGWAI